METTDSDFLYGMPAIARFLGMGTRQAYHVNDTVGLPTFKLGQKLCARKSTLNDWLAKREAEGTPDA